MIFEIYNSDGELENTIIAELDFVEQYYPGRFKQVEELEEPPLPPKPDLVLVQVTPTLQVAEDFVEVTCLMGEAITFVGELQINSSLIPLTDTFRMPVRARDGREKLLLVKVIDGKALLTVTFSSSGLWEVTEESLNEALPADRQMAFKGLKIFVVEET
jgi:hypothetical protein